MCFLLLCTQNCTVKFATSQKKINAADASIKKMPSTTFSALPGLVHLHERCRRYKVSCGLFFAPLFFAFLAHEWMCPGGCTAYAVASLCRRPLPPLPSERHVHRPAGLLQLHLQPGLPRGRPPVHRCAPMIQPTVNAGPLWAVSQEKSIWINRLLKDKNMFWIPLKPSSIFFLFIATTAFIKPK